MMVSEQFARKFLNELEFPYPTPDRLQTALVALQGDSVLLSAFARAWWTEGIPYAYKSAPGEYERLRNFLAERMEIAARNVTLIGSGRFGYSIVPRKDGSAFSRESDLDFLCISNAVFEALSGEFNRWLSKYETEWAGQELPPDKRYYHDNARSVPKQLERGLIDLNKIPLGDGYLQADKLSSVLAEAKKEFADLTVAKGARKFSLRIFRDWNAAEKQLQINLNHIIKQLQLVLQSPQ